MDTYLLNSVYFKKLKGLNEVSLDIGKHLTAIMGVNGSGKSTVIHALACVYTSNTTNDSESHRFPEFFIPNTDALWNGSEFTITHTKNPEGNDPKKSSKTYSKKHDRWAPPYKTRPLRPVYYLGISTCTPEIEKIKKACKISYSSKNLDDQISNRIIKEAATILNIDYQNFFDNKYKTQHFPGVSLVDGLTYSSLSMGTGEQRTIKILSTVLKAPKHSLILIDEIDLLLHISSLSRLIKTLYQIAKEKQLQIIFTSHSLEILNHKDIVKILYLHNIEGKTQVFHKVTPDLIYSHTGIVNKTYEIYVEDDFAKSIVQKILKDLNKRRFVDVTTFGVADNAFTLAASVSKLNPSKKTLFLLDGDVYTTTQEKQAQLDKRISGNDPKAKELKKFALSLISQFNLPSNQSPECFLKNMILKYANKDSEVFLILQKIKTVSNQHDWINGLREQLGDNNYSFMNELINDFSESDEWKNYISPIVKWVQTNVS